MKRKQAFWGALAVAIAVLAVTWLLADHRAAPAVAGNTESAPEASVGEGRNSLRYPAGAPQLTMIESRTIPATPVPLADALSARVVYDEDATARIGVAISGRILALKAAPGDVVKAGQVLAVIDSPDVGTAHADLDKAHADEARKRLVLARAKDLATDEAIAAKDVEAAQADAAQAHAETARAMLRLKNLNPHGLPLQGQRISLTSPLDGVVSERTASPALEVSPSTATPLFVVTDPRRLWLMIDLPEKLLGRMKVGSAVTVESDAYPGEQFKAKVVQLGQTVDTNTRRVTVRARLDNGSGRLLPEMFVRASVLADSGSGVQVPNGALVNRGVYTFVFVQPAPGEFQRRQVRLLTKGSDFSYVGEGLAGGESIVVGGALLLDAELSARAGDKP